MLIPVDQGCNDNVDIYLHLLIQKVSIELSSFLFRILFSHQTISNNFKDETKKTFKS